MNNWDIFISYSRLDRNIIAPIVELLRIADTSVFRDEDSVRPGKKWLIAIHESLNSCRTVVLFWSAAAAESKWVESEYQKAIELNKDIVPVLLDDTPLIEELCQYQWIDFRALIDLGKKRSISDMIGTKIIAKYIPGIGPSLELGILYKIAKKVTEGGILPKLTETEQATMTELLIGRIILKS